MGDKRDDRAERINETADALCRGKRHEAADRHVESMVIAEAIIGHGPRNYSDCRASFLAGWDAAMKLRHDELAEENHALHGIILDLCTRMHVRRCDHCHGESVQIVDGDVRVCEHCDQGFIDINQENCDGEGTTDRHSG
jgi:hypothetical protein